MQTVQINQKSEELCLLDSVMAKFTTEGKAETLNNVGYSEKILGGTSNRGDFFTPTSQILYKFNSDLFKEQRDSRSEKRGYKQQKLNPLMAFDDSDSESVIKCKTRYKAAKLSDEIFYATQFGVFNTKHKQETKGLFVRTAKGIKCMLISTERAVNLAMQYHLEVDSNAILFIDDIQLNIVTH